MSNKDLFYANWKGFLEKQKLQEASDNLINAVSRATEYAEDSPELLPFGSIFGDKLRVVQPLVMVNVKKIISVLKFAEEQLVIDDPSYRYKSEAQVGIEYNKKSVTMKQKPLGWVQGDPIPNVTKEIVEVIVKVPRLSTNPKTQETSIRYNNVTIISALNEAVKRLNKKITDAPEFVKNTYGSDFYKDSRETILSNLIQYTNNSIKLAKEMQTWWQENQAKFILDSNLLINAVTAVQTKDTTVTASSFYATSDEELGQVNDSEFSLVYSRSPIDVVRMSDFSRSNIKSCHSEGNGFINCAIAEAQNEGAIVYVVKTEDLEGVDLTQTEIFEDDDRNIPGILPISRVRLRNLTTGGAKEAIAVPEIRVYGQKIDGFVSTVEKYVAEKQIPLVVSEEGGVKTMNFSTNIDDYVRKGGSYQDNPVGTRYGVLINTIAELTGAKFTEEQENFVFQLGYGRIRNVTTEESYRHFIDNDEEDEEEDEEEFDREEEEGLYGRALYRITSRTVFKGSESEFDWQWGEGYADIRVQLIFDAVYSSEILSQSILEELKNPEMGMFKFSVRIRKMFEGIEGKISESSAIPLTDVYAVYNMNILKLQFVFGQDYTSADDFSRDSYDFVERFEDHDIEEEITSVLTENGIIGDSAGYDTPIQKYERLLEWFDNESYYLDTISHNKDRVHISLKPYDLPGPAYRSNSWFIGEVTKQEAMYLFGYRTNPEEQIQISDYEVRTKAATILGMATRNYNKNRKSEGQQSLFYQTSTEQPFDIWNVSPTAKLEIEPISTTNSLRTNKEPIWRVFCKFEFQYDFRTHKELIDYAWDFFEKLDEDPESFVNAYRDAFGQYVREKKLPKEFTTRGEEAAQQQKTALQTTNQELTESRKRIIKERLINWYKKNKGRR